MSKRIYKFRKRPVVIEAYQTGETVEIETREGTMRADPGDWIITGVEGEQYPCKPDIFRKTYELVGRCEHCDHCRDPIARVAEDCRIAEYMDAGK